MQSNVRQVFLIPVVLSIMSTAGCSSGTEAVSTEPKPAAAIAKVPGDIKIEYQPLDIPSAMKAGTEVPVRFVGRNVGSTTWSGHGDAPFRFGYHWSDPDDKGDWTAIVWDDGQRGTISEDVPPAGRAEISMKVRAPNTPTPSAKLIITTLFEPGRWTTDEASPLIVTVEIKK